MADLSLRTAHISWSRYGARQLRGLGLAVLVAVVSVPAVLALRAADLGGGQLANLVVVAGGAASAVAVLGLAWLVRPALTLGDDGQWIMGVVRSRKSSSKLPMDIPA